MTTSGTTWQSGGEAKKQLYREIDELAKIAARHDSKGIKIKLKEIVPEYVPQENESSL